MLNNAGFLTPCVFIILNFINLILSFMPRIDEMPQFRAQLGRTSHDLSHKFGFTATVAHLLPVFHDFLNPGETVELGVSYNLRTQPLASAAMVDINSHVEYFFVPINLIYEPFGSYFYNLQDQFSSFLGTSQFDSDDGSIDYDLGTEYGLPYLDWSSVLTYMQSHDADVVGFESWFNHVYRLLDHLGFNNEDINISGVQSSRNFNPNVFPYALLAYNCIYQYYYRLDTREHFNQFAFNVDNHAFSANRVIDASNFNFLHYFRLYYRPKDSDYFTDVKVSPIVDIPNLNNKGSLALTNDWLTRQNSATSVSVLTSGGVGSLGNNASTVVSNAPGSRNDPNLDIQTNFGFTVRSAQGALNLYNGMDFNTANIRAIFANEKLWSITGRACKHYDDQTLAHFGYEVPHDPKHEISCFGHDRGKIHIGEVISTADTSNAGLGEIAGKGYGSLSSQSHKFTAPCHGVVMAILSFVPDVSYGNYFLKANSVSRKEDFFVPEYDHLGMQPLFGYEGNITGNVGARNSIVGWQYRYEQWKRRFNRVSKAFVGSGNLDSWMLDFQAPKAANVANTENYLEYLHSPSELNQIMLVNYVTDTSGTSVTDKSKTYDGDPFVVDSYIHCKKVSTMSDFSLPRLDA